MACRHPFEILMERARGATAHDYREFDSNVNTLCLLKVQQLSTNYKSVNTNELKHAKSNLVLFEKSTRLLNDGASNLDKALKTAEYINTRCNASLSF